MAASKDDHRTGPASKHRQQEARKQGQIPLSSDLAAAVSLGGVGLLLSWQGPHLITACGDWLSQSLLQRPVLRGDQLLLIPAQGPWIAIVLTTLGLLGSIWFVSLIARLMQIGPLLTLHVVQPRFERISLAAGWRRMVSATSFVPGLNWLLKLLIIGGFIGWTLTGNEQLWSELSSHSPRQLSLAIGKLITSFVMQLCGLLIVAALFDYGWQRWRHEAQLRMTDEERRAEQRESTRRRPARGPMPESPLRKLS